MEKKNQDAIKLVENSGAENATTVEDGYPFYPVNEDIYVASKLEADINTDNLLQQKIPNESNALAPENEKDFSEGASGSDLDVPGTELDDEQEALGSEDEENNYYSLGGDNHNNLDENFDEGID